ncbi:PhnB protein [Microbacterium resistens]|uniref:PhnB protein n=1 Tax=Microbacterium resistens TaxID=156977 RepID=A0ABU1S7Q6_9MICO|nr:VOC family protein [Microbacterium resistens]MDR6865647.1 PhnB protein [Microbacterium resistens]
MTENKSPETGTTPTTGVTGVHTTGGRPNTATSLTPFLAIPGAAEAIAFYRDVFGARVVDVTEFGGVVAHADLDFGLGLLQLGEPSPEYRLVPPPSGEEDCYSMGLYVADVDAVVDRAVAAGATVREAPSTFVSGDRFASIRDPFGVRWSVMTRVEDLSEEESARRVAEWAATFTQAPTEVAPGEVTAGEVMPGE